MTDRERHIRIFVKRAMGIWLSFLIYHISCNGTGGMKDGVGCAIAVLSTTQSFA